MTFREKWFQEARRSAMKMTSKDASSGNDHPAIAAKVGVGVLVWVWCPRECTGVCTASRSDSSLVPRRSCFNLYERTSSRR